MSKMVDNAINDLEQYKDDISCMVLVADAGDFGIMKIGAENASTAELLALVGSLEAVKLDILAEISDQARQENILQ